MLLIPNITVNCAITYTNSQEYVHHFCYSVSTRIKNIIALQQVLHINTRLDTATLIFRVLSYVSKLAPLQTIPRSPGIPGP